MAEGEISGRSLNMASSFLMIKLLSLSISIY